MGKGILLMVAAVMLGATFIAFNTRQRAIDTTAEQSTYQHKVLARDIAQSGIDQAVSDIRRNFMDAPDSYNDVSLAGGSYDITVSENIYGDLLLETEGEIAGARHFIDANLIFAAPLAAPLQIDGTKLDVSDAGSYVLAGGDVRAPSRVGGAIKRGYFSPANGVVTNDAHIGQVSGALGNASSVAGGFQEFFFEQLFDEAVGTASLVSSDAQLQALMSNASADNPKIAHVQGNFEIDNAFTGYGLLVVEDGDLTIDAPDFNWEGLILVRKEARDTVSVSVQGGKIHGGLVAYEHIPDPCGANFEIQGNSSVPQDPYRLEIQILGAAITYGAGGYDIPVTARIKIGDNYHYPWGSWDSPVNANLNDGGTYSFTPDSTFAPGTPIRIDARSWVKKSSSYDGTQDSHWNMYMEQASNSVGDQLAVLEDGSDVPDVAGFDGQESAEAFVADYISGDEMTMENYQSIYLFELGSTNTSSPAHDMQDLVALTTMTRTCPVEDYLMRFDISGNSQIRYSAEALAKLGKVLQKIRDRTSVAVVVQEERAPGQGEPVQETPYE